MDYGQTRLNGAPAPEQITSQPQNSWEQVSAIQFGAAENVANGTPDQDPNRMGEIISIEPAQTEPEKGNVIDLAAVAKTKNAALDTSELAEDPKTKKIGKKTLQVVFAAERQILSGANPGEAYSQIRNASVSYVNNSWGANSAARDLDSNLRKAA